MKSLLKKLGFRRMDEMERYIAFRAQRNAYLFLVAALVVWTFAESWRVYAQHTRLNLIPCMLLAVSSLIQSFSQIIMTRNAVKDDEDSCETAPLLRLILLICVVAGVVVTVGAAMVLMSVRI